MGVVAFDTSAFKNRFREFGDADAPMLTALFAEACIFCNNTDASLIKDTATRGVILNLLVAHLLELNTMPLVGRVADVTVGGIPVHADYTQAAAGSRAWYEQTKYGAQAWAMTAPYRRFLYVASES